MAVRAVGIPKEECGLDCQVGEPSVADGSQAC